MCIGKSMRVAGTDWSEIGFETFVNPRTPKPETAEGSISAKYRISQRLDRLIVGGMRLGIPGSPGIKM
jgi:hypothetical protein